MAIPGDQRRSDTAEERRARRRMGVWKRREEKRFLIRNPIAALDFSGAVSILMPRDGVAVFETEIVDDAVGTDADDDVGDAVLSPFVVDLGSGEIVGGDGEGGADGPCGSAVLFFMDLRDRGEDSGEGGADAGGGGCVGPGLAHEVEELCAAWGEEGFEYGHEEEEEKSVGVWE